MLQPRDQPGGDLALVQCDDKRGPAARPGYVERGQVLGDDAHRAVVLTDLTVDCDDSVKVQLVGVPLIHAREEQHLDGGVQVLDGDGSTWVAALLADPPVSRRDHARYLGLAVSAAGCQQFGDRGIPVALHELAGAVQRMAGHVQPEHLAFLGEHEPAWPFSGGEVEIQPGSPGLAAGLIRPGRREQVELAGRGPALGTGNGIDGLLMDRAQRFAGVAQGVERADFDQGLDHAFVAHRDLGIVEEVREGGVPAFDPPGGMARRRGKPQLIPVVPIQSLTFQVRDVGAGGQGVRAARPQNPLPVGQQLPGQAQRPSGIPALTSPVRDVMTGGQGGRVAGAQDPLPVGQQLPGQAQRPSRVPALTSPGRDVAAGGQGGGVAGAQDPFLVGQQFPGQAQRPSGIPAPAGQGRDVGAGGQGVRVTWRLDVVPEGEFVLAVGEGLAVATKSRVVGGEGVVDAELVVARAGGQGGQVGFEDDVLQPGVGARPGDGVENCAGGAVLDRKSVV